MKAVILVGGLGTRLRPLTCSLPKPMLPVLNRPFIEYVIYHLKEYGINEVILSAGYLTTAFEANLQLPADIKVHFIKEPKPLGTCGAVKQAEELLTETFLVLNGDILTDLNLKHLIAYHQQKKAAVTIALTTVDDPTSYGLVPLKNNGLVEEFLEKPSWDEVTTNLINAGTYVIEPEVLAYAPKDEPYSFERGLFPLLLEKKLPVYGFPASGYWLDIGSPEKYLRAHHDLLEGQMHLGKLKPKGKQLKPGVWVGKNCKINPQAIIFGPVLIGDNCTLEANSSVIGPTVIGNNCFLGSGSRLEASVLDSNCHLETSAVVKQSILAQNSYVGHKTHIEEVAVLGKNVKVGANNWLKRGIKIWPDTTIPDETVKF